MFWEKGAEKFLKLVGGKGTAGWWGGGAGAAVRAAEAARDSASTL